MGAITCALGLSACTATASPAATARPTPPFPTPLATSMETADGTWATLPMGHPDDPLNTFWQLFLRPTGQSLWSNQVEATATATNGGLTMANRGGQQLVVTIRPSVDLRYTPMIATSDAGESWTNGLIDTAIAAAPNALALGPAGGAEAIVDDVHGQSELLSATSGISSWRILATTSALDSEPATRSCSPSRFTAVAYTGPDALVGAACTKPGSDGMFLVQSSRWQVVWPVLPATTKRARAEVLGLDPLPTGVAALLGFSGNSGEELVASWTTSGTMWESSGTLHVPSGESIVSYGPSNGGVFVLLSSSDGAKKLYQADTPGSGWLELPGPPSATETLAYGPGSTVDALAVEDTVLTVYTLTSANGWAPTQIVHVAIQFGSSS
jgi:hypothetical protein